MEQQQVDTTFNQIVNRRNKERRPPSKFPELRYLWGITLLGSFILIVVSAVITTIIEAL
jgi:hypothetical protein